MCLNKKKKKKIADRCRRPKREFEVHFYNRAKELSGISTHPVAQSCISKQAEDANDN